MKGLVLAVVALGLIGAAWIPVLAFNVNSEVRDVRTFQGPEGSMFGLTVLGHHSGKGIGDSWVLVGAPNSTSEYQPTLPGPPGALYKCQLPGDGRCTQVLLDNKGNEIYDVSHRRVEDKKDGQFLGVALTRKPGPNGKVVVCGHRWINQDHATRYPNSVDSILYYARGICYSMDSTLQSVEVVRPCILDPSSDWWRCLAGASAEYAVDGQTLMLGAPGAMYNLGSVITVKGDQMNHIGRIWNHRIPNHQYPYLGYSLTSGHFSSPTALEGATGGPRYRDLGTVYIFDLEQASVVRQFIGEPVNSYFGASVEAADLNGDGWSDLLVGAPLYSSSQDEGRVYVYINDGMGNLEMRHKLGGSNAVGARFGFAIESIPGDLNKDGYPDVAIGAPYEDETSGAVYIYHGSISGINPKYSQRIAGKSFNLVSFGAALSGALDLDGNSYPDLIVGAHLNNSVVYLRTKPVIYMQAQMDLSPPTLVLRNASDVSRQPITCTVSFCMTYSGVSVNSSQDVVYTLEADTKVSSILQSRVYFGLSVSTSTVEEMISLVTGAQKCLNHTLTVKSFVQDFLNPITVQLSYRLRDSSDPLAPVLSPSSSSGIQKEIGFARDCGLDDICEADLQFVNYSYSLLSGREDIFLGADSIVYITAKIANVGEEAHRARLVITHPENVVYEAVGTLATTELMPVKCEPVSLEDGSNPYVDCSIGNPLKSNGEVTLQVRMDIGNLAPSQTDLNVSLVLSTSSTELELGDNEALVTIPVTVLADVTVKGAFTPEQLVYRQDKYNLRQYLGDVLAIVQRLRDAQTLSTPADPPVAFNVGRDRPEGAVSITESPLVIGTPKLSDQPDQDRDLEENVETFVNDTEIGPTFVQKLEISNLGPGRVPYASVVNVSIPWRTPKGDWLIFITQVQGRDGVEACNLESLLEEQYQGILTFYNKSSNAKVDRSDRTNQEREKRGTLKTTFDCTSAECVTVQCEIEPLAVRGSSVIEVHARLWKYSFLKSRFGLVTMKTKAVLEVKNPQDLFSQPDGHLPDETTVKITISAQDIETPKLPLPPWVIPVSISVGIFLLILIVTGMAWGGFFQRKKAEKLKQMRQSLIQADQQEEELLQPEGEAKGYPDKSEARYS
ncbi:integrin alpha-9-like [Acanthaster planci]|uniref:Integrin alpha-9-like n=1 Tax=Acanthaster planci TaxID=133434 RepID=A0A8B7XIM4_ACAPL|nr:integrin alpha-9-like [Acanthaster planci]